MYSVFSIMDGGHNSIYPYEDSLIVNSVRSRKKHTELPNCPVCSCTIRPNELASHMAIELDRLHKLNSTGGKRKLSGSAGASSSFAASAGSSSMEEEVDVSGCTGGDVYQRVKLNRIRRLRTRARRLSPAPELGECPVCGVRMPMSRLQRHALRCLRRTGAAPMDDEEIPDSSSEEEGTIDVENDEASAEGGGTFGAEYRWCGEWRVRAQALQSPDARAGTSVRRASVDTQLVVDGDEDTELYGPPQYSPSRILADPQEPSPGESGTGLDNDTSRADPEGAETGAPIPESGSAGTPRKHNGLVEASAETRVQALTAHIRELEARQSGGVENKCLICLGPYASPAVSIQCWHVYCECCWLESLRAKKICPQCNVITNTHHLRRIYM